MIKFPSEKYTFDSNCKWIVTGNLVFIHKVAHSGTIQHWAVQTTFLDCPDQQQTLINDLDILKALVEPLKAESFLEEHISESWLGFLVTIQEFLLLKTFKMF